MHEVINSSLQEMEFKTPCPMLFVFRVLRTVQYQSAVRHSSSPILVLLQLVKHLRATIRILDCLYDYNLAYFAQQAQIYRQWFPVDAVAQPQAKHPAFTSPTKLHLQPPNSPPTNTNPRSPSIPTCKTSHSL